MILGNFIFCYLRGTIGQRVPDAESASGVLAVIEKLPRQVPNQLSMRFSTTRASGRR